MVRWIAEINKKPSECRDGLQYRVVGQWGWGMGHWDSKLTRCDNGRRQPACQVSSRSVQPFCRNSRFCPIRGKNAAVGHFRRKFRRERINSRQPALGRRRMGLSYGRDPTLVPLLVWAQSTSVTDGQTDMPLAKTRYTSVLRAKKFLIFKIRCLSKSEKILSTVVVIQA